MKRQSRPTFEPNRELNDLIDRVAKAAIEVHKTLGPGYAEKTYESALCIELGLRRIRFERQKIVQVWYKGECIGTGKIDVFIENQLVVELKAVAQLLPVHTGQVISYLKVTKTHIGILINFKAETLKGNFKRIIRSHL